MKPPVTRRGHATESIIVCEQSPSKEETEIRRARNGIIIVRLPTGPLGKELTNQNVT